MKIIPFRPHGSPALTGASPWQILAGRARAWFGGLANRLGVPGFVRPLEFYDEVTGQGIAIAPGPLFTRITLNGRDYYFRRFSGRFDGTGFGCAVIPPAGYRRSQFLRAVPSPARQDRTLPQPPNE